MRDKVKWIFEGDEDDFNQGLNDFLLPFLKSVCVNGADGGLPKLIAHVVDCLRPESTREGA